ncbi:MAG: outer membrane lipoprotein carrier protein LolA [Bacteroidota bacterium]
MKNKAIVFLFLLMGYQVSLAQEKNFKPMKDIKVFSERFDQTTNQLTSIRSNFIQEKHLSFMDDNIVSKGIFRYKKDNKVRLEYNTPFQYLMVLNNGKMYIKDGNKVNKFDTQSNKLFRQINDMMINTLNGNVLHSKAYSINYLENESTYLMELKPLDKTVLDLMQQIKIYIDKKKLSVGKIEITEKSGDYTLMSFLDVQQNTAIKDEEFVVR